MVAVEPNNLVEHVAQASADPPLPLDDALELLRFDALCQAGKRALGHGDHSVGERLPGLLHGAGLVDLAVHQNDRCPALFGACDGAGQRELVAMMRAWADGAVSGWGRREDARPLYVAGGGDTRAFDDAFDRVIAIQRGWLDAIDARRFSSARGYLFYLASGRKPA